MCFEDFCQEYTILYVLRYPLRKLIWENLDLTQNFLFHRMLTDNFGDKYEKYSLTSEWKGVTAGGCINNNTWYKVRQI